MHHLAALNAIGEIFDEEVENCEDIDEWLRKNGVCNKCLSTMLDIAVAEMPPTANSFHKIMWGFTLGLQIGRCTIPTNTISDN